MKNIKIVAIVFMLFIGSIFVNGQSQIPSNFMGLCGCCDSIMPIEEKDIIWIPMSLKV